MATTHLQGGALKTTVPPKERARVRRNTAAFDAECAEKLCGNKREQRPMHDYSLERFGLNEDAVREAFASYRARFIV